MRHQRLRTPQHQRLRLSRRPASLHSSPDVVLIQPLRRLQCPHCALPVVQAAEVLAQAVPVDHALPVPFHHVHRSVGALATSRCARAAVLVDDDGFGLVEEGLQGALEAVEGCGDFLGHESGVDVVESLDQLQESVVARDAHWLVDFGFVLLVRLPRYSGSIARRDLRQELVLSQQRREREQVIGIARRGGEVAG